MKESKPWDVIDRMDGKTTIKFQMPDSRWASLIPDHQGLYGLFVEERQTPDQMADQTIQRRADRISRHKGIPDMGLPPAETPVDPQQTLADMKRLEKIPDVKIRRRPKHGRA